MAEGHRRVAAICFLGLLLFWQPRVPLTDDIAQAAGLWSLADGHLGVRVADLPPGFDPFLEGRARHFSFATDDNASAAPFGSLPLNIIALPMLSVLRLLALAVGEVGAVSLTAACLASAATYLLLRSRSKLWARWAAFATWAVVAVGMARTLDATVPYLELASLQLVNIAATTVSALVVWDLTRRFADERTATWVALLAAWGTPLAFWAISAKYHALATTLTLLAIWLYREGCRTSPLRTIAAFLVAGLAVWNSVPFGVVVTLVLAALAIPVVRLPWREAAPRIAAILGVSMAGLATAVAVRLGGAEGQYLPSLNSFSSLAYIFDPQSRVGWLAHTAVTEPWGTLVGGARAWFWPDVYRTGPGLPLAATAPIALLAFKGWRDSTLPPTLRRALVGLLVVHVVLFGSMLDTRMSSLDLRYFLMWWPVLLLLAAPAIAQRIQHNPRMAHDVGKQAFVWFASVTISVFVVHNTVGWMVDYGPAFEIVWPWRLFGLGVAAAMIIAAVTWQRFPAWTNTVTVHAAAYGFALQAYLSFASSPIAFSPMPAWAFWPMDFAADAMYWLTQEW